MLIKEAQLNIGQPFKIGWLTSGLLSHFDIIKEVKPDGTVLGDFIIAACHDCRLKELQPIHLQKSKN